MGRFGANKTIAPEVVLGAAFVASVALHASLLLVGLEIVFDHERPAPLPDRMFVVQPVPTERADESEREADRPEAKPGASASDERSDVRRKTSDTWSKLVKGLARSALEQPGQGAEHLRGESSSPDQELVHLKAERADRCVSQSSGGAGGRGDLGRFSPAVRRALVSNTSFIEPGMRPVSGRRREPFNNYLLEVHKRRVHPVFADRFLKSLDRRGPRDPLNDWHLRMVVEFEIMRDGQLNEMRVVLPSGNALFDGAAVDSLYGAAPFPRPPRAILSWNDRVYVRWAFHRNNRKCGMFIVEPYIVDRPTYATRKDREPPADPYALRPRPLPPNPF